MAERNKVFEESRDIVVEWLRAIGLEVPYPQATLYVWAKLPEKYPDSKAFSMSILDQVGIWLTSGIFFGQGGEGYVRTSLTEPTERLREAMERLKNVDWTRIDAGK